jgi:AraC family transcriptional regulator
MRSPSCLVDLHPVSAVPGVVHPPAEPDHIIDIHVGEPVRVNVRMDGSVHRGLQATGDLSVVPAGVTARWDMGTAAEALLLRLAPSLVEDVADGLGLGHSRATLTPALVVRDPHILHLSHLLKTERASGYPSGCVFIESIGSAVAARLLCRQASISLQSTMPTRELPLWRLRTVREYIDAHLDRDLSLAELARVAGFSVSHFKPLFKRAVGVPVHRYVVEQRVERARRLILQGGRSMTDIALEAGFTHQSHMARWVRRVLGITPAEVAVYRH